MKKSLLVAFMILSVYVFGYAATHTTDSCSTAHVQAKVDLASDGDTIIIKNGSCTWTTGITTSKQLKFQGETKGSVIILLSVDSTLFAVTTGASYSTEISNLNFDYGMPPNAGLKKGSTDNYNVKNEDLVFTVSSVGYSKNSAETSPGSSVISSGKCGAIALDIGINGTIDLIESSDNAGGGHASCDTALINISAAASGHVRLGTVTATKSDGTFTFGTDELATAGTTTVTFSSNNLSTSAKYLSISGASTDKPWIVHDCDFNCSYHIFLAIDVFRMGGGLVYLNNFWGNDRGNGCEDGNWVSNGLPCGGHIGITLKAAESQAIASWATDSTLGTNDTTGYNNIYVEDNTFTNIEVAMDWDDGARAVVRRNTFNDSPVATHGADTSGYGVRHVELYDNVFVKHNSGTWTLGGLIGYYPRNMSSGWWGQRGGVAIVTGNTMPEISDGTWGTGRVEALLQIQQIDRAAGPDSCCQLSSQAYPCLHQVGRGKDNGSEKSYIWDNTYSGDGTFGIGIVNSGYLQCQAYENWNNPGFYIQSGRDYETSAAPGWVRYTYPHPLRDGERPGGSTNIMKPVIAPHR